MKKDLPLIIALTVIVLGFVSMLVLINIKVKKDQYNNLLQAEQEELYQLGETYYYPYTKVYWGIETQYNPFADGY